MNPTPLTTEETARILSTIQALIDGISINDIHKILACTLGMIIINEDADNPVTTQVDQNIRFLEYIAIIKKGAWKVIEGNWEKSRESSYVFSVQKPQFGDIKFSQFSGGQND